MTPAFVVHCLLVQVLHGNAALTHVASMAGRAFSAAAYCRARARLPLAALQALLEGVVAALDPGPEAEGPWRGRRTFLVDGSSFSTADTPELRRHFGLPGNRRAGRGYPTAKVLALFHAPTGLLTRVAAMPCRDGEVSRLGEVHPALRPGDVLVGDRGFVSFAHLAALAAAGVDAVFRVNLRRIVDFTPGRPHARPDDDSAAARGLPRSRWLRALGVSDQVVEWLKPGRAASWMDADAHAALPATLAVRELRYEVGRRGFRTRSVVLATTLLDAERYTAADLAELYGARWRVEQDLRDLKQSMGMDELKCQSVEGVLKELTAYAIAYDLVRAAAVEAARRQGVRPDRISFVDALRWLRSAGPGDEPPRLIVVPTRPGRVEPRAVKRRPKDYPGLKGDRRNARQLLMDEWDAA